MITSQRALKSAIAISLAAGLSVSLSGCFGNPLEDFTDNLIENTVENAIEGATGVDVDVDGDGTGGSLPKSWPAEVPAPDGDILFSLGIDDGYSATINVGDEAGAQAGYDTLISSGFEMVSEISLGDEGFLYGLQNDNWIIQYSWGTTEEDGTIVNMIVSANEG
ncbi:hypothetical protein I6E68_00330 [Salinibacterium sp. NSLL150]|uniref:hypothetical protein n=1 Tax=unclassified Salinibacterium TaxID=2632331 RepID=UPI0018CDD0FD|nr:MULTISPECIES: hypothetical protein [unclassified Salinibacterium]MBH0022575.1 hypothetical protein [Salinibacterium sp. SWN248]MBH0097579.1 hypothetical protein [Salinibacterium sp. NSLL35]MBH0100334.1 hypothetical protein [Salinibacterium sp. NSLL150]MBH0103093.1 hypothetical protein [Salinibacterium sp. NSLL16]MBH0105854.1 hypothetical protein [Salinibacterium sp. NSLL17]